MQRNPSRLSCGQYTGKPPEGRLGSMAGDLAGPRGTQTSRKGPGAGFFWGGGWAAGVARVAGLAGRESGLGHWFALLAQGFRSHWAFGHRRGGVGARGLQREKKKERHTHAEGQPPGVIFPGSPPEDPPTRPSFSFHYFTGKTPTSTKDFQTAVSAESFQAPRGGGLK